MGSGSTPRNGAGSIATVAADRPRPASSHSPCTNTTGVRPPVLACSTCAVVWSVALLVMAGPYGTGLVGYVSRMLQHASLEVTRDRVADCVAFWQLLGFTPMEPPP